MPSKLVNVCRRDQVMTDVCETALSMLGVPVVKPEPGSAATNVTTPYVPGSLITTPRNGGFVEHDGIILDTEGNVMHFDKVDDHTFPHHAVMQVYATLWYNW